MARTSAHPRWWHAAHHHARWTAAHHHPRRRTTHHHPRRRHSAHPRRHCERQKVIKSRQPSGEGLRERPSGARRGAVWCGCVCLTATAHSHHARRPAHHARRPAHHSRRPAHHASAAHPWHAGREHAGVPHHLKVGDRVIDRLLRLLLDELQVVCLDVGLVLGAVVVLLAHRDRAGHQVAVAVVAVVLGHLRSQGAPLILYAAHNALRSPPPPPPGNPELSENSSYEYM